MNEVSKESIKERIIKVFDFCGVEWEGDDVNLELIDSFTYISTLVELENEFNIEFPEQFLVENIFSSITGLTNIIFDIVNEKLS